MTLQDSSQYLHALNLLGWVLTYQASVWQGTCHAVGCG